MVNTALKENKIGGMPPSGFSNCEEATAVRAAQPSDERDTGQNTVPDPAHSFGPPMFYNLWTRCGE